jgi:acyl dehydratase
MNIGDRLPSFTRVSTIEHWTRFAAVSDEFADTHIDDDAARAAGFPSAYGLGSYQVTLLHNLLRDWHGDGGRILTLNCRFHAPNTKGMRLSACGQISAITMAEGQATIVELDIWTADEESGTRLSSGTASVEIPNE